MGLPIGTEFVAEVIRWTVDQTVVSVGPYMFHSPAQRGRRFSARSRRRASPPQSTFTFGDPPQPAWTSARHVTGVACITVQPNSWMSFIRFTRITGVVVVRSNDHLPSGDQGQINFQTGDVKRQSREGQQNFFLREPRFPLHGQQEIHDC